MNDKKETDFIFAIGITLTLFTVALILFCGEDFLKALGCCWVRIIFFIALIVFAFFLFISLGFMLFTSCNTKETKSWIVIAKDNEFINKNAENVMFDTDVTNITSNWIKNLDNLEQVEIYGTPVIDERAFSKCKNLQEVTFYEKPKSIDETAFEGCSSLATMNLIGNGEKWKTFRITLPKNCKVNFIEQKSWTIQICENEMGSQTAGCKGCRRCK